MKRIVTGVLLVVAMLGWTGVTSLPVSAQSADGYMPGVYTKQPLNKYEQTLKSNTKLGGYDDVANSGPTVTAAKVINWLLTLLGAIAISLSVYAGVIWMLARGNEDEVKKAKDILAGSAMGLLIILASYSITAYIFNSFILITN